MNTLSALAHLKTLLELRRLGKRRRKSVLEQWVSALLQLPNQYSRCPCSLTQQKPPMTTEAMNIRFAKSPE